MEDGFRLRGAPGRSGAALPCCCAKRCRAAAPAHLPLRTRCPLLRTRAGAARRASQVIAEFMGERFEHKWLMQLSLFPKKKNEETGSMESTFETVDEWVPPVRSSPRDICSLRRHGRFSPRAGTATVHPVGAQPAPVPFPPRSHPRMPSPTRRTMSSTRGQRRRSQRSPQRRTQRRSLRRTQQRRAQRKVDGGTAMPACLVTRSWRLGRLFRTV